MFKRGSEGRRTVVTTVMVMVVVTQGWERLGLWRSASIGGGLVGCVRAAFGGDGGLAAHGVHGVWFRRGGTIQGPTLGHSPLNVHEIEDGGRLLAGKGT